MDCSRLPDASQSPEDTPKCLPDFFPDARDFPDASHTLGLGRGGGIYVYHYICKTYIYIYVHREYDQLLNKIVQYILEIYSEISAELEMPAIYNLLTVIPLY